MSPSSSPMSPGSSQWFNCGFVTYSNEAKQKQLGRDGRFTGAAWRVSEQVVIEMSVGALVVGDVQRSVAISGVAGTGWWHRYASCWPGMVRPHAAAREWFGGCARHTASLRWRSRCRATPGCRLCAGFAARSLEEPAAAFRVDRSRYTVYTYSTVWHHPLHHSNRSIEAFFHGRKPQEGARRRTGQIEKQFGKGSVMRLGDASATYDVEVRLHRVAGA